MHIVDSMTRNYKVTKEILSLIMAPNGNSGLSGVGQTDKVVRCGLTAVYANRTHTAGQVRFV